MSNVDDINTADEFILCPNTIRTENIPAIALRILSVSRSRISLLIETTPDEYKIYTNILLGLSLYNITYEIMETEETTYCTEDDKVILKIDIPWLVLILCLNSILRG